MEIIRKGYTGYAAPTVAGLDEIDRKLYAWAGRRLFKFHADTLVNEGLVAPVIINASLNILVDNARGYVYDLYGAIRRYTISPFAYDSVLALGISASFFFFNADKTKLICVQNSNPVVVVEVDLVTFTVAATYTVAGVTGANLVDINYKNNSLAVVQTSTQTLWQISLSTFAITTASVLGFTAGQMKIDPINNIILLRDNTNNRIVYFDSTLGVTLNNYVFPNTFITNPTDMVIDYLSGYLYFAVLHRDGMAIYKFNYLAFDKIDTYFLTSVTSNMKLILDLSNKRNRVYGYALNAATDEIILFTTDELTSSFAVAQSEILLDYIDEENNLKPLRVFGTKTNGPKVEVSKLPTIDIDFTTTGSPITITASLSKVVDMKLGRRSILLYNEGPNPCRIGKIGVTFAADGFLLPVGASITLETNKSIYAICNTGLTTKLSIEEELYT